MKTKLKSILMAAALTLAAVTIIGCANAANPGSGPGGTSGIVGVGTNGIVYIAGMEVNPTAVGSSLSGLADVGATIEISKDANARDYFGAAASIINASIAAGDYNPTNLQASLATISINGLKNSATVQAVITSLLGQYNAYFAQITASQANNLSPYILPALQGIANGLTLAYNATAPATFGIMPQAQWANYQIIPCQSRPDPYFD